MAYRPKTAKTKMETSKALISNLLYSHLILQGKKYRQALGDIAIQEPEHQKVNKKEGCKPTR